MRPALRRPTAIRRWLLVSITLALCLGSQLVGQNLDIASELSLGIAAFDHAKYGEAILHLQRVVTVDPQSATGHFYLAEAYDKVYSENCERNCVANERRRQRALEEFQRAYELNPSITESLKAIAWRYDRINRRDEADRYYRKVLTAAPDDFEALYNLAVLNWRRSYELRQQKRADLKLARTEPLINSPACIAIRGQNLARVDESIGLLTRSEATLESRDVQEYLGLLYRERADIQCGDQSGYDRDAHTAMEWDRRACKTVQRSHELIWTTFSPHLSPGPPLPPFGEAASCRD